MSDYDWQAPKTQDISHRYQTATWSTQILVLFQCSTKTSPNNKNQPAVVSPFNPKKSNGCHLAKMSALFALLISRIASQYEIFDWVIGRAAPDLSPRFLVTMLTLLTWHHRPRETLDSWYTTLGCDDVMCWPWTPLSQLASAVWQANRLSVCDYKRKQTLEIFFHALLKTEPVNLLHGFDLQLKSDHLTCWLFMCLMQKIVAQESSNRLCCVLENKSVLT